MRRARFVDSRTAVETFQGAPRVDWQRVKQDLDVVAGQGIGPRA